jgi:serine/threonine-protein kinase HipA
MMTHSNEEQHFAVHLHGRMIGALHRKFDYTWLTFEPSYLEDPNRAVLGLRFEEDLRARHAANLRLPPWFSNLLPEGRLREWIGEARGAPITCEMELLAHVGHDLPGAVQVFEADDAARLARETEREIVAAGPRPLARTSWRFSLAGVGLKFSMLANNDRFTAPGVGEGGDWIIKLPDPDHAAVPINEFTMMTLARASGIEVPDVRLVDRDQIETLPDEVWPHGERTAYAVRRFDRAADRTPIHIEDLAQVRGFYPDDKYHGSFETVASILHRGRDVAALLEFTRRLAFNILISNGDAHLKNWSLIYTNPRIPTLAPAYDLVATSLYRPSGAPENMGLRFCGSRRFERVTSACFASLEKKLGVAASLTDEVSSLVERVLAAWPDISEQLRDHAVMRSQIEESIQRGAEMLLRGHAR